METEAGYNPGGDRRRNMEIENPKEADFRNLQAQIEAMAELGREAVLRAVMQKFPNATHAEIMQMIGDLADSIESDLGLKKKAEALRNIAKQQ